MDGTITLRASQAHCYRCGATEIAAVCARCQHLMCQTHRPPTPSGIAKWVGMLLRRLRVVKPPYDGSVLLCRDCQVRPLLPILSLILVLALGYIAFGLWTWANGALWGVGVLVIGLLWLGVLWFAARYLSGRDNRRWRETIHVNPRVDRRQVQEWIRGHIVLSEQGNYDVVGMSAEGRLTLEFSFSEADQERVGDFVAKRHKARRSDLRYHAGFIVLGGRVSNQPLPLPTFQIKSLPGPVVVLEDMISNASFLTSTGGHEVRRWQALYSYGLLRKIEAENFNVQVLPAIRPDTKQRVLDLTVQWLHPIPEPASIMAYQIGSLMVQVPRSWGSVEYASEGYKPGIDEMIPGDKTNSRVLRWENVSLSPHHQREQQRVFTVKFDQPICQTDSIQGLVHVTFYNSLSGVTGVEFFSPTGQSSQLDEDITIETIVVANFDLNLATLRHQRVLMFPNPHPDALIDPKCPGTIDFLPKETGRECDKLLTIKAVPKKGAAIPPDTATVVHLTNALSEAGFFINWIIENPPHTGSAADITCRYWDVGGRYYQGVNPIDFHLIITGDQQGPESARLNCQTDINLSVKGAFIDDDMRCEIVNVWSRLNDVLAEALDTLQQRPGSGDTLWEMDLGQAIPTQVPVAKI